MNIKKQIFPVLGCLIYSLLLAPPVSAQETTNPPASSEAAALTNTATNGTGPQATNEVVANKTVRSSPERWNHAQPLVLIGQDADLKAGDAAETVVVIGGSARIHGHVHEAVVVIGGDLEVDGDVGDAVVAIFGNVHLNQGASIRRDAVAVLGSVSAEPEVKIGGNAVAVGGKLDLADGATVQGEKVNVGFLGPFANFEWLRDWFKYCALEFRPLAPQVKFVWIIAAVYFLIYLFIAAVFPRPVQMCVDDLNRRPVTVFLLGLLTKLLVSFLYLILAITGVGLIVAPIIWVALLLCAIIGKVALMEWLGSKVGRHFGSGFQKPLAAFLLGTLIITLLYMVPVLGLLAYLIFGVWGLGCGVTAAFGSLRKEAPGNPAPPAPTFAPVTPPPAAPPIAGFNSPATPATGATLESSVASEPVPPTTPQPAPSISTPPLAPEASSFPKAALWERLCAAFLDIILIGILSGVARVGPLCLVVALAYFAGMWWWRGTTIGGIVLKLKVIREDGRPLSFVAALVRGLAAAFSVVVLFLGFLWIAWDKDKQGWHDKIAGTVVIRLPHSTPLVCL
ncbi:MAG TPA: RDD family protein [Verrucomicrobiae bacterium]|nr:RDD family protein [Verrucomicrobiae bacterium]